MQTMPFGSTGHVSSRVIFGAASLWRMPQEKADQILDLLLEHGVNHIDTAAMYGDSELRVGAWMPRHRARFFLASKTIDRTATAARDSVHRSLERLRVDHLDLIQLHNLVEEDEWATAFGPGGALEALVEARQQGLVRCIGVTGHGTLAAAMHLRSLERFPFDSVLLPYNFIQMQEPVQAADFERLAALCAARGVAMQTIKSVARRRWPQPQERAFSWYEPLRDAEAIRRAVHFVLARPGVFLNTSSDATLLRTTLAAAAEPVQAPSPAALQADVAQFAVQPLFVRGVSDAI